MPRTPTPDSQPARSLLSWERSVLPASFCLSKMPIPSTKKESYEESYPRVSGNRRELMVGQANRGGAAAQNCSTRHQI